MATPWCDPPQRHILTLRLDSLQGVRSLGAAVAYDRYEIVLALTDNLMLRWLRSLKEVVAELEPEEKQRDADA